MKRPEETDRRYLSFIFLSGDTLCCAQSEITQQPNNKNTQQFSRIRRRRVESSRGGKVDPTVSVPDKKRRSHNHHNYHSARLLLVKESRLAKGVVTCCVCCWWCVFWRRTAARFSRAFCRNGAFLSAGKERQILAICFHRSVQAAIQQKTK